MIPFQDHTHDGVLHNGFGVEITADYHQFNLDLYKAWLRSDTEVVVTLPTVDFAFSDAYGSYEQTRDSLNAKQLLKQFSSTYEVARMVVRNRINLNAERKSYNVLLKFPYGVSLTNSVFTPGNAPFGTIAPQVVPQGVPVIFGDDGALQSTKNLSVRLAWRISCVEDEARRAVHAPTVNPSATALKNAMSGMSI